MIANTYHYLRGGDCTYTFGLTELLQSKGHTVAPFAMHHPNNFDSPYSDYFVSYLDYVESLKSPSLAASAKVAYRSIYSKEARMKIEALIDDFKPDIAHFQNIHHHLTPSIMYPLKKRNIPIVWTLHDYKHACPNSTFLCNEEVCEKCKKSKYYSAALTRCKKNSFAASLMACVEAYSHRLMRVRDMVDMFLAPSDFLRMKLIEYGVDAKRITHIPNFIPTPDSQRLNVGGDYFVYAGRLSSEKGVDVLLRAMAEIKGARLAIAGDGPMRGELQELAKDCRDSQIEFLGFIPSSAIETVIGNAMFVVVPSKWYENCPYSILESFALGKPVVGARIGGIPEMVKDGVNGFLFEPGNEDDLRDKIEKLSNDASLREDMSLKAYETAQTVYNPETHYEGLMSIYGAMMAKTGQGLSF